MSTHLKQKYENTSTDHKRFQFIELLAIWEGGVNTTDLQNYFEISRPPAQTIIKHYCGLYPKNLNYNASEKCYQIGENFTPQHSNGTLTEYVALKNHNNVMQGVESLATPIRKINPTLIQPIIKAIKENLRLDIYYASVSNPDFESRIIQPHNLVFDGMRWHVRAYCEKNKAFRDFVLSRFRDQENGEAPEFEGPASQTEKDDDQWNNQLQLEFMPDLRLNDNRRKIIALDYDMENKNGDYRKTISVRQALLMYQMQRLRLDQYQSNAQAQQITLSPECQDALKAYL